jgi:hypothetical protein
MWLANVGSAVSSSVTEVLGMIMFCAIGLFYAIM